MPWRRLQEARAALIVPQRRLPAALLRTAYGLWPAPGWGAIGGVPIGQAGALAIAAVWIVWGCGPCSAGASRSRLRPAGVAATHAAAVVLIFPNEPGARLVLPLYVCLLPYVAVACAALIPDDLS